MPRIIDLSSLNLGSLSQSFARLDHFYQARFRNRFGPTVRALAPFIPRAGTIFDIGANHGKFAKNFAKLHDRSCTVWCFEPLPYNYTLLESIVRPYTNVRVFKLALSDRAGTADLFVPVKPSRRILPGSAHLGDQANQERFGTSTAPDVARITIPTDTLDALAAREHLAALDFIKIDVEGAEALVFRGGLSTLSRFRPAIYCELQPGRPECLGMTVHDVVKELADLGYRPHTFPERAARPTPCQGFVPGVRDYLFLHPTRPG
jgi:FkbM family methyltransferase